MLGRGGLSPLLPILNELYWFPNFTCELSVLDGYISAGKIDRPESRDCLSWIGFSTSVYSKTNLVVSGYYLVKNCEFEAIIHN